MKLIALAGTVCGLVAPLASADTTAFTPTGKSGTQNFDTMFGIDFNTNNAPVMVTSLGVFDNGADGVLKTDSLTQPIVVQIWNRDTGLALATVGFGANSPTGTGTDTPVGSAKVFFQPISITLPANGHYYISEDYSGSEEFFNSGSDTSTAPIVDTGGGLISVVGGGRASNVHNTFFIGSGGTGDDTTTATAPPGTTDGFIDGGPAARYAGPDFTFTPEPASLAIVSLAGLGLLARRRSPSQQ